MNWIAIEIDEKPYVIWQSTDAEPGGLVVTDEDRPPYEFGVCLWKIVDGALVERDGAEMAIYEAEYAADLARTKINDVNAATFDYDSRTFPMHEAARLLYSCVERTAGNYKVMATDGEYNLLEVNNTAFLDAYYNKLKELTEA